MLFSQTTHTILQLNVKQLVVRTAGGLRFTDKPQVMFHTEISNSTFETKSEAVIVLNDTVASSIELIVTDCKFTGNGIVFSGTSLEISNSCFDNISSEYGALDFLIKYRGEKESTVGLLITNSSFTNNQGELAADIGLRSDYLFTSLNLSIRDCNFSHFNGTSGGSIFIGEQWLNDTVIESCRFDEGAVSIEKGVIRTLHSKGTLNLMNVLFDSICIPNSYVIQVTSLSIPFIGRQTRTNLTHVTILNCTYQVAVSLIGKSWMTLLHSYQCHFAGNHGVTVRSDIGAWEDVESIIEHNTAEDYPCYSQVERSMSNFQRTQFLYNSAHSGSCIHLRGLDSSNVFIGSLFQGNTANYSGGVMLIEQGPAIIIINSRFVANAAPLASVMQLINLRMVMTLIDSVLQENQGNGVIMSTQSALTLIGSSFLANSGIETAGIILIRSNLTAFEVSFSMQTGLRKCLFDVSFSSSVNLTRCQVSHLTCIENIFEVASNSTLTIKHSRFTDLISQRSVIYIEDGIFQVDYFSVERISTTQAFFSTVRTNVSIQISDWRELKGRGVQANSGKLFELAQSKIRDVNTGEGDTMLQCTDMQMIRLAEVSVSNMTGGAGLRLQAVQVQVKDCVFRQVRGREGGALWVDSSKLEVLDSVFVHNSALVRSAVSAALRFSTNNTLIRNCTFAFNTAASGASIFYSFVSLRLITTTFWANQALYSPDIASFSGKLFLFNLSTIVVTSGQHFIAPIVVGMLDDRNQLMKTYANSQAWLVGVNLTRKFQTSAKNGLFSFCNFTVTSNPGRIFKLTVRHTAFEPITLDLQVRNCLFGETRSNQACVVCPPSTYSVDSNHSSCKLCPSNGSCPGDGQLYPGAGYWETFRVLRRIAEMSEPESVLRAQ